MKLHVENFAKIKEADIEINGITVIAGENNTGKSTIGKILYCLYNGFHNLNDKVVYERKKSIIYALQNNKDFRENYMFDFDNYEKLIEVITRIYNSYKDNSSTILNDIGIKLSKDEEEKLNISFLYSNEDLESLIINKIFNVEFKNQLYPINIDNPTSKLILYIKETENDKKIQKSIDLEFANRKVKINNKIDLYKDGFLIDNPFIIDLIDKNRNVYAKRTLFFELIGIEDSIKKHNEIIIEKISESSNTKNSSLIEDAILNERLEKYINILKDTIEGDILEKENKFVFYDSSLKGEIELENLSTGVKSLAILLKLIENHEITDNSMIIFDEPEIHLHPKWQLKFAEILVLLQKEFDLNIVLTTHSPYFINAIEVFSAKHEIADKCKYYLSDLDENNKALFEDVTQCCGKIYDKLAEPFDELEKIMY